jgi:CBS domain-containing protein
MNVEKLMSRNVQRCGVADDLNVPARILWENDCGCVPVVDAKDHVVGMITDRDICIAAYTQGRSLRDIPVREAMSKKLYSCRPADDVSKAVEVMRREQVRRLPVVDENARLVGVLSLNDLACEARSERASRHKELTLDQVGLTLASVCVHRSNATKRVVLQPMKPAASREHVGSAG